MEGNIKTLGTGEVRDFNYWELIRGKTGIIDDRLGAGTPAQIIMWYDKDFVRSSFDLAILTSRAVGRLHPSMLRITEDHIELEVETWKANPSQVIALGERTGASSKDAGDGRDISVFDLFGADRAVGGTQAPTDYYFTAMPNPDALGDPVSMFQLGKEAQDIWWLENYVNINSEAMKKLTDEEKNEEIRTALERKRQLTAWSVSDPRAQSLAIEYAILRNISRYIFYEAEEINPIDREAYKDMREIIEQLPLSKFVTQWVGDSFLNYGASFDGRSIEVIPLPSCLLDKMTYNMNVTNVGDEVGWGPLHRESSRFSFWASVKPSYERWVEDFFQNRFIIDGSYHNEWQSFFGTTSHVKDITSGNLTARQSMFADRMVISSDGVNTSVVTNPADEAYARFIDGTLRERIRLNREPVPDNAEICNPPALTYVPPETWYTRHKFAALGDPGVMRGERPPNVYTPKQEYHFSMENFLNRSGGIAPSAFGNLLVVTEQGVRPPEDGDILYESVFFFCTGNGIAYRKPTYDITSFYVVDANGYACRGSERLLHHAYFAGIFKDVQPNYLIDQPEEQDRLATNYAAFSASSATMTRLTIWRVVRWLQSSGTDTTLGAFQGLRETCEISKRPSAEAAG
jgi:hypothetical protein